MESDREILSAPTALDECEKIEHPVGQSSSSWHLGFAPKFHPFNFRSISENCTKRSVTASSPHGLRHRVCLCHFFLLFNSSLGGLFFAISGVNKLLSSSS